MNDYQYGHTLIAPEAIENSGVSSDMARRWQTLQHLQVRGMAATADTPLCPSHPTTPNRFHTFRGMRPHHHTCNHPLCVWGPCLYSHIHGP
jgi:hypothetical protein